MFNDALTTFRTREVVTSTSTMRQALSLLACLLLAAAAAYPQTLKRPNWRTARRWACLPTWWVAAQSPGSMDLKGPRGEGIPLGAALPVYNSPPGPAIGAYRRPRPPAERISRHN